MTYGYIRSTRLETGPNLGQDLELTSSERVGGLVALLGLADRSGRRDGTALRTRV